MEKPELSLEVPASYRAAAKGDADAAVPALAWWRGFRSAELTGLMESAQQYNLDIAVAIAQIVQADAQAGVSGAALLPSISGSANAERQRVATGSTTSLGGGSTFSQYSLGLSASYIVDFWGKNRATLSASEESATSARYNREVVALTTMATVANT
ncbi:TolC family protein, partial [Bradyrhizobium sp.]|uniref:TolC family protein n=1 Tax=Bradyrhizobium sp. TaxID=376 RepID=UPI0025BE57C2